MKVALTGLAVISGYKIGFTGFKSGPGMFGFVDHLGHHCVILVNLLCLLSAFALLSRHFEKSHVPLALPKFLPHDWKGGFILLAMIWVLSSFLDNIAAALIGGAMAHQFFRARVHIGYLAAIVAAANAGGAWSVVGDTTTTMMWLSGSHRWRFSRRSSRHQLRCWSLESARRNNSTNIRPCYSMLTNPRPLIGRGSELSC